MGVKEVKCGDDEKMDKFQSMSEFWAYERAGQEKEADPGQGKANGGWCSFRGAD
jgi:hypothetical protein